MKKIMDKMVAFVPLVTTLLIPAVSQAAAEVKTCSALKKVIDNIAGFGGGVLFAIAVIVFLIGAFHLLFGAGSEDAAKKGRQYITYGIVGIIVGTLAFSFPTLIETIFAGTGASVLSGKCT